MRVRRRIGRVQYEALDAQGLFGPEERMELIVEVAESALRYDLTRKAQLYGEAGVPDYWVVDLVHDVVVVHRDPAERGYASVIRHAAGVISPLRHPAVQVDVARLLR